MLKLVRKHSATFSRGENYAHYLLLFSTKSQSLKFDLPSRKGIQHWWCGKYVQLELDAISYQKKKKNNTYLTWNQIKLLKNNTYLLFWVEKLQGNPSSSLTYTFPMWTQECKTKTSMRVTFFREIKTKREIEMQSNGPS